MPDGNLFDVFRDKHREYLQAMDRVWVSYHSQNDCLELSFRCNILATPPINWLRQLSIEFYHEQYGLQATAEQIEWFDVEGSFLTARCARPSLLLPDGDPSLMSSFVPIGDVIIYSGKGDFEKPLYNEFGQRVMRRNYDPYYSRHRLSDRDPFSSG